MAGMEACPTWREWNPALHGGNGSPPDTAGMEACPTCVNSRAMFTTHSRVMFTSDDRVGVYHFKESYVFLLLLMPPFFERVDGNFLPE